MRLALFLGSLALALALGLFGLRTPDPRGGDAPAAAFSTARAMNDVRIIAAHPHPVGSVEHRRVRGYLFGRMTSLGLTPTLQTGALSPQAIRGLERWGVDPSVQATNIVGVLPGKDSTAPAVLLMAHYDTVPNSPGAADDTTGVAAILEAVRAIKARGLAERSLVVLFTDAEELNLDGARVFFTEHPLRDRIGAVVNLEARGGGGRALMFETGPGNRQTLDLFQRVAARADGGASSNSLAVLVYRLMPNGTDFTIAGQRRLPGLNFAFMGRPALYHALAATPDAIDPGSVQHIGSLALESTDALLRAPALPVASQGYVYADVFGHIVGHAPPVGWALIAAAVALLAFAFWGAQHGTGLSFAEVGRGMLGGLWMVAVGTVVAGAVRALAGPTVTSMDAYYLMMRRLPWVEASVSLAMLAVALVVMAGRETVGRKVMLGVVLIAAIVATILGGFNPILTGATIVALGLGVWAQAAPRTAWGRWLGLIALVLTLAAIAQSVAPEAAFLLIWPGLAAALAAALAALISARMARAALLVPAAVVTVLGIGWLMGLAHFVFLGIGMDIPGVLALLTLLMATPAAPLAPLAPQNYRRAMAGAAAASLILACAVALTARHTEPPLSESASTTSRF